MNTKVTKKEVVGKRSTLFKNTTKGTEFRKGDKRVYSHRLCVICSRPLTSLVLSTGRYTSIHNHTRFFINEDLPVHICTDIMSCYRTLRQEGRLIEDVDG